ncbi:hypothetical protein C8J57DRAFT_1163077 [Mycena rebaudengoi]|nr:hypothetical protein C8J57DRAFT_1163077 [Mycena rebaudengoi]
MSTSTIVVPAGLGYVAASFLSTAFVLGYQTTVVNKTRRAAKIEYPRAYAEKAEMDKSPAAVQFNCAQRAHQNTLENLPIFYTLTLITSIKYPLIAATCLGLFSAARVGYTRGYTTGDPKRRHNFMSVVNYPALLTLLGASVYTVFQLIQAGI